MDGATGRASLARHSKWRGSKCAHALFPSASMQLLSSLAVLLNAVFLPGPRMLLSFNDRAACLNQLKKDCGERNGPIALQAGEIIKIEKSRTQS